MIRLRFCLLAAVACSLMVFCQGDGTQTVIIPVPVPSLVASLSTAIPVSEKSEEPPQISTSTKSVSVSESTTAAKTASATASPTTSPTTPTSSSISPPTISPTTTISPPTTPPPTTAPPTTPPPTTSPPTTSPPTTPPPTTPAPAPTPAPGPLPPPKQGTWPFTDQNNVTCILVKFAAQLNVTYPIYNSSTPLGHLVMNVPSTATVVNGSCNGTEQWLEINWPVWNKTDSPVNSLVMVFSNNATTKLYALEHLNLTLMPEVFPNASSKLSVHWQGSTWRTPQATSYRCTPATQLNLTAETVNQVATITLTQLQEEAFRMPGNSTAFSAPRDCGGGDVPDAVPIAVGCALGGLVLVVLVAYLVGRRRSPARGYLSM